MHVRRFLGLSALILGVTTTYVASPFVSAWSLREAVMRGDAVAIEPRVEWASVRQTLKSSLAREANLLPIATEAGAAVRPTMWQRVKSAFGSSMLDRFIETYVTPEGLPKLMDYRRTWKETTSLAPIEPEPASRLERMKRFWDRVKRAEFVTPTKVVIEIVDKNEPDRRYVSVMEMQGLGWRLTGLEVKSRSTIERTAVQETTGTAVR